MTSGRWIPQTYLKDIAVLPWEEVLRDVFAIEPSLISGNGAELSLGRIAELAGMTLNEVITEVQLVVETGIDIEISCEDLSSVLASASDPKKLLLLDVREPWEFEICSLERSILLYSADFMQLLPSIRQAERVVTICHHGMRSYSAAMYLRNEGILQAQSLAGGLARWAAVVDQEMATY